MQLYILNKLSSLRDTQSSLTLKQHQQLIMQNETRELLNNLNAYDIHYSNTFHKTLELSFKNFVDKILIVYKQFHKYYHISQSIKQAFAYHKIVNTNAYELAIQLTSELDQIEDYDCFSNHVNHLVELCNILEHEYEINLCKYIEGMYQ